MKSKTLEIKIGPLLCRLGLHGWQSWIGFFLAATIFVVCAIGYSLLFGIPLALGFCLVATLRLDSASSTVRWVINLLWLVAMMCAMCIIAPVMVGRFTFFEIPFTTVLLNLLCCLTVASLCLLVAGKWRIAISVCAVLLMTLAVVNGYVYFFREREFAILDVYTATTAMKVAGQYNYTPTPYLLYGIAAGLMVLLSLCCLPRVSTGNWWRIRLVAMAALIASGLGLFFGSLNYTALRWGNDGSALNGTYLNFFLSLRDAGVKAPNGYSPKTVEELAQDYPKEEGSTGPNIIVIMNEAYCDLDVYPNQPETNIPVTPYWDSLQENTIRGYALSSVYGGNTANSEFEFLTGSTMAFLPTGAVPYTQYIGDNAYSLAWTLQSYGYTTMGTHNYIDTGWSRDQVYPWLGFQASTFQEDYPQKELLRGFISDREQYGYLLQQLDKNAQPAFLFAVSMQNHGGYWLPQEGYNHNVTLGGSLAGDTEAEQYLSLLNASDQALEFLFTSLENRDEKTIVLLFGDHQPKLQASFYEALNGGPLDTLSEQMTQYTVPFVIWANYDIEEKDLGLTSLNYLSGHLLDAAGLERSTYHKYLADLEQTIPAMNLLGYYSLSQGGFVAYDQATGEEKAALEAYKKVQYNAMFDEEHQNKDFFARYLPKQ